MQAAAVQQRDAWSWVLLWSLGQKNFKIHFYRLVLKASFCTSYLARKNKAKSAVWGRVPPRAEARVAVLGTPQLPAPPQDAEVE